MTTNRTIYAVKKSNFLTQADADPAIVVTVKEVVEEEVSGELKFVCYFTELEKGIVLNWINSETIAKILGSEEFDDWPGGKITLYREPNVMNLSGQRVGGIRVRAPRKRPVAPKPAPKAEVEPDFDDEIPWDDEQEVVA